MMLKLFGSIQWPMFCWCSIINTLMHFLPNMSQKCIKVLIKKVGKIVLTDKDHCKVHIYIYKLHVSISHWRNLSLYLKNICLKCNICGVRDQLCLSIINTFAFQRLGFEENNESFLLENPSLFCMRVLTRKFNKNFLLKLS